MQNIQAAVERVRGIGDGRFDGMIRRCGSERGSRWEGRVRVAKEHKDVPNPELSGKGDGIIKESEVPACAVGRG